MLIVEFSQFHHELDCDSEHLIFTYLLGLKMFNALVILLDLLIVHISSKGTVIYDTPRQNLYRYLHARFLVLVLETLWTIMGNYGLLSFILVLLSNPITMSEKYLLQWQFGVCACMGGYMYAFVCPSKSVRTITSTIMDGFQNNLTQLFYINCRCAIWKIGSGGPKVKVSLEG